MPVSKESLSIKLNFLFRLLDETGRLYPAGQEQIRDHLISKIFFAGTHVLHSTRQDNQVIIDYDSELMNKLQELILERFNEMNIALHKSRCSGLPITLTYGEQQMIVIEGIEELTKAIEHIYQDS